MRRFVILLLAILCANANNFAQKNVSCNRKFTCWNEASQKDTILTMNVEYGRSISSIPEQMLSFDINIPHGNPHISIITALFKFPVDISATKAEKFLGVERTQKFEMCKVGSQMQYLRSTFIRVKEIFQEWSETAKKEGVTNYHKVMTDKAIFNIPCVYRCLDENDNTFFFTTWQKQKDVLKPEFIVDEKGNCKVFWGAVDNNDSHCPKFFRNEVVANYGGLSQRSITQTHSIRALKAGLWFTSPEQIQSLIDVLDYDSIVGECKTQYHKKDSRDELFK